MQKILLALCKLMLLISIFFWGAVAVNFSFFSFPSNEYLILKALLFLEPVLFAAVLYGLKKKNKVIYAFSLFFVFANVILSVTDEIGAYDIASAVFNLLLLADLILIRKQILTVST